MHTKSNNFANKVQRIHLESKRKGKKGGREEEDGRRGEGGRRPCERFRSFGWKAWSGGQAGGGKRMGVGQKKEVEEEEEEGGRG